MIQFLKNFVRGERGAVTVDWVVLCAAVVGLALLIVTAMQSGALTLAGNVGIFFDDHFFTGE